MKTNEKHKVSRIHLKTNTKERETLIDFCLKSKDEHGKPKQCLAIGWSGVYTDPNQFDSYVEYYDAVKTSCKEKNKRLNHVLNLFKDTKEDDLFWTRDLNGNYWICRAIGEAVPYCDKSLDIGAILPVEAYEYGLEVPGQIKASFNRPRGGTAESIKELSDDCSPMYEFTKYAYNKSSKSEYYKVDKTVKYDMIDNLPDFDLEELVISYIQIKYNYYLLSNSIAKKSTTIKIECELMSRDIKNRQKAVVQVKGPKYNGILNADDYKDYLDEYKVFLYAPNCVNDKNLENVICITKQALQSFYNECKTILPESITTWEKLFE